MTASRNAALICLPAFAALLAGLGWSDRPSVRGFVVDQETPLPGARVRWQGSKDFDTTDAAGRFCLRPSPGAPRFTAWKDGYRIGSVEADAKRAILELFRLPDKDNPDYAWISPDRDRHDARACANCHQAIHDDWSQSAHSRSATNPRLLSLSTGLDGSGKRHSKWNVSAEHPLGVGVCSRCHAPTFRAPDLDYDLRRVTGVATRGVHCDLCHKIVDVPTDRLGARFGIDGLTLLRPHGDEQIFYGSLEDAVREGESFGHFPLFKESRFCASCHEGTLFGVKAYTTYSEWLESPAGQRGVQCQQCHMAPSGALTNIAPGNGGIERDPFTLSSHAMAGASRAMLENSVKTQVGFETAPGRLRPSARIRAENVGHRVPTGFIDRHIVLLLEAWDATGKEVFPSRGLTLPSGMGDPWAGRAGWIYGRWLVDEAGNAPQPFWIPPEDEVDTRLWPELVDRRTFDFPHPIETVRVRVIYRKFWPELAQSRGWEDQQTTVFDRTYRSSARKDPSQRRSTR